MFFLLWKYTYTYFIIVVFLPVQARPAAEGNLRRAKGTQRPPRNLEPACSPLRTTRKNPTTTARTTSRSPRWQRRCETRCQEPPRAARSLRKPQERYVKVSNINYRKCEGEPNVKTIFFARHLHFYLYISSVLGETLNKYRKPS